MLPTGVRRTFLPARVPRGVLRAQGALAFRIPIVAPSDGTVFDIADIERKLIFNGCTKS